MKAWKFNDQNVETTEEESIRLINSTWCDLKVKDDLEKTFHKFESSHSWQNLTLNDKLTWKSSVLKQ